MMLRIFLFIYLLTACNLFGISELIYKEKNDLIKLKIVNGKIQYDKNIKYPGFGIGFDYDKEPLMDNIDLLLNFNSEKIETDFTLNYAIKEYSVKFNPSVKYKNSITGGFKGPQNKIVIKVNKNNYLSNSSDLGSFYFDFFMKVSFYNSDNILLRKGIYDKNKFYGIICRIKDKKIVIQLENFYYNQNGQSFSFLLKSNETIELNKWTHVGFIFDRINGKILLYINGEIEKELYAKPEQTFEAEILTPKFKETDGSDLVLFENYFGYVDNFRIGKTSEINFSSYINSLFNKTIIESELIDFKYINSQVSNIKFNIRNNDKGIINIFFKFANELKDIEQMEWSEYKCVNIKDDMFLYENLTNIGKYFKWKIEMTRNSEEKISPVFYFFQVKFQENRPPLAPNYINISEYNNIIQLNWALNLENDVKGYMVYWGRKSKNYENKVDVGLKNNYILDFLKEKQNYYFAVKAYDSMKPYNLSDFSKEAHLFKK